MLTCFSVCKKDTAQLIDLLHWIGELGGCKNHSCLIVADYGTPWDAMVEIHKLARASFKSTFGIHNNREVEGWIEGPKSLMITAINHAALTGEPFLQMDSDAIPLVPDWLDKIEAEYLDCVKGYMGHLYACHQEGLPPLLMSPVAVYSATAKELIPLIEKPGVHWDVEMTPLVVPNGAHTKLIHHLFGEMGNPPTFGDQAIYGTNQFSLEQIPREAVIFHRNKDGTLIDLLRKNLGIPSRKKKLKEGPMSFFQMGRFGDLILLLPAFKRWADETGQPVNVYAGTNFATLLEGASYIIPRPIPLDWASQTGAALQVARHFHPDTVCCQLHGAGIHCPPDDFASYSLTMWDRTGLMHEYMDHLPVFDRRNKLREIALVKKFRKTDKPLILVNFNGHTSPMRDWYVIVGELCKLGDQCEILNTNEMNATRIYDLLGVMDQAAGLITLDTMTLHLAPACQIPYIAYVRDDGQAGSIPKGNCVRKVGYSRVREEMGSVMDIVRGWIK